MRDFKASINSSPDLTGPPIALAKVPFASAKLRSIFLAAVAAEEASKPALLKTPRRPVVSSKVRPNALATGPTLDIALSRYSNERADLDVDAANTSAILPESSADKPNILIVEPAREAALDKSVLQAVARFCTSSVIEEI